MVEVRNVKEFAVKNEEQLIRFFKYKTGIFDKDMVDEHIQEFYVKLIQTKALEGYDKKKGNFDTYIATLLCWVLPAMAKKNVSIQHEFVSVAKQIRHGVSEFEDIWEHTTDFTGPYKFDRTGFIPDTGECSPDELFEQCLKEFKEYLKRTESENSFKQMMIYLEYKQEGFKSAYIAKVLGVSDNLVKLIKQRLQKRFILWKTLR
jgi:hypothetical protein